MCTWGPTLTEKTAAIAWARAWNTRNLELLRPLMHHRVQITDQRNWESKVGADLYLQRMQDYFDHVPAETSATTMELAETPTHSFTVAPPRPCVIEYRRGQPVATFLFRVHGGLIRLVEKRLLPPPTECILTGSYPGLEDHPAMEVN